MYSGKLAPGLIGARLRLCDRPAGDVLQALVAAHLRGQRLVDPRALQRRFDGFPRQASEISVEVLPEAGRARSHDCYISRGVPPWRTRRIPVQRQCHVLLEATGGLPHRQWFDSAELRGPVRQGHSRCLRRLSLHQQRRVLSPGVSTRDPSAGLKLGQARQALFKIELSQTILTRIFIFIDLIRQIPSFRRSLFMIFYQIPNEEGDERNGKTYFSKSIFSWPGGRVGQLKS